MKNAANKIWAAAIFVFLLSIFSAQSADAAAEPIMKVKLKGYLGNQAKITVVPEVAYSTNLTNVKFEPNKKYTLQVSGSEIIIFIDSKEAGRAPVIEAKPVTGNGPLLVNGRPYLGSFSFTIEGGKYIRPYNSLGLEDYLKGVVPFEMPALWNQEALKTQAVAARTYAMGYMGKTPDDTISYQVYGGYAWHENATKAVKATEGQVIGYGSKLHIGSDALYSSSNGGRTESNKNVWGGNERPYLKVKNDPYDPQTVWSFSVKKQQIDTSGLDLTKADTWWANIKETEQTKEIANIKTWLQTNGYAGKDIKITAVPKLSLHAPTSGGRVTKGSITLEFLVKERGQALQQSVVLEDVAAAKIRAIIGLNFMKSYLVDKVAMSADEITVSGKGYGHGVGLSQYGAKKAGELGKSYREILAFYYEGTSLKLAYQPEPEEAEPVKPEPAPVIPAPTPAPEPASEPKDETAPVITNIHMASNVKTKQVNLSFHMNEKANVTVGVKNAKGQLVATLIKGANKPAGIQTAVWSAAKASSGTYTFEITAIDGSGNASSLSVPVTITKADAIAPVIKNTKTSYDTKTNKVFLKYEINEKAKVTVQVKDANGKIWAVPVNNATKNPGVQWTAWNAAKAAGGKYSFVITAADDSQNKREAAVPFTLAKPDKTPPVISGIKTSYDATTKKVSLTYKINEKARVTAQVKDAKGKTAATLTNNAAQHAGLQTVSWNAAKAASGKYTFIITAIDSSKNKRTATAPYTLVKQASAAKTGKVNVSTTLNVRSKPSTAGQVIGKLKKNQNVMIISKSGSWYKIKYGKGTGYVHANYITVR